MAATQAAPHPISERRITDSKARTGAWISAALTFLAIGIHGYHPCAEDGGVYLAGVKWLLHPGLYPAWSGFVTAHLKFSFFAPIVAGLVHLSHLGLTTVMLLLYAITTWLTLFAAWLLASRCYSSIDACIGAVMLLALSLTIPVAGTSLMLMDPYVTARSISTPCGILMLVAVLDLHSEWIERRAVSWQSIVLLLVTFIVSAAMHPLMAAYAWSCVLLLACISLSRRTAQIAATWSVCVFAVVLAACIEWMSAANSPAYVQVAHTRTYWFLSNWQWYELLGLIGPIAVLLILANVSRDAKAGAAVRLASMAAFAGGTACLTALLFAHASSRSYEVAKLQPLRIYQTIYFLMIVALGAAAADRALKRSFLRWGAAALVIGGTMFFVQRQTFPASAHIELPQLAPANPWHQAFDWIRIHTPEDAVFALDANYISADGEDSQCFRAISERSAMPDYSKDGGIASIAPVLTLQWLAGQTAQRDLDSGLGPDQIARLRGQGATWVVLTTRTPVSIPCNYVNSAVKVCKLP